MYLLKQELHQTWSLELFRSLIEWFQTVAQSWRLRVGGGGWTSSHQECSANMSAHINRL